MKRYAVAGVPLLDEDAAATAAGVNVEAIRRWKALGLLDEVGTPDGPRYDQAALLCLLEDAWQPGGQRPVEFLTPQQASRMLGVGTPTLAGKVREGRVTCSQTATGLRRYLGSEIRAIKAERERLRRPWWPEPKTS